MTTSLEEGTDLLGREWAAVTELASLDVLELATELGSAGVLEFGRLDGDLLPGEELGDDVELGWLHGSGGEGADETTEALLRLGTLLVGQHGESNIFKGQSRRLGLTLVGAASEGSGSDTGADASGDGGDGDSLDPDGLGDDGGADGGGELGGDHVEGAQGDDGGDADLRVHLCCSGMKENLLEIRRLNFKDELW